MVSVIISGKYCWGNQRYPLLSGALGPSPSHEGGLGTPFLFGRGVAVIEDQTEQQMGTSLVESFQLSNNYSALRTNRRAKTSLTFLGFHLLWKNTPVENHHFVETRFC